MLSICAAFGFDIPGASLVAPTLTAIESSIEPNMASKTSAVVFKGEILQVRFYGWDKCLSTASVYPLLYFSGFQE